MKPYAPILIVFVALGMGGCATTTVPEKSVIVTADQTEIVTPIGSHIRTRVLKGQKPVTPSPVEGATGEQMNDSLLSRDGSLPAVPVH